MAKQVTIVFNEDGRMWADYLQGQLQALKNMNANVFLIADKSLFSDTLDTRSQTYILHSSAVLVIVTPEHMDYILSKPAASYEKLVPNVDRGVLFLVGITEEKINEKDVRQKTREVFPNYSAWTRVNYVDNDSINVLMGRLVEIMERPDSIQSSFTLIPTTLHCEEETTVVAMIDEPIPEKADVKAVVTGSYFDAVLPCQRNSPYTYTFLMPKHLEDEVTVIIKVNKCSLGSQAKLSYKSYISCSDQTAINEIYCYMLDQLCSYVKTKISNSNVENDVDEKLSVVFDHLIDLPAVGYEKLFGIYQNLNEGLSRSKLPTLVHLGAMHNLTELVARLQDLPFFANTLSIQNSEQKTPRQIAQSLNYKTLAEYLEEFEEQVDQYAAMMYGDHTANYYNKDDITDLPKPDSMPADLPAYADMTGSHNEGTNSSAQFQNEEFYMDMEIGGTKEKQEDAQIAFTKWQRKYMNDGSNSFKSKQAALQKTKEELSRVKTTASIEGEDRNHNKPGLKNPSGFKYGHREPIPPPVPERMPNKPRTPYVPNQAGSGMYLDLPEKSISETGETYDYADTNQWLPESVKRRGTSRNNSARSSGSSSGRGSTSSTGEDSSLTKRFSSTALDLPEPPPVPRRKDESTKQQRAGRFH